MIKKTQRFNFNENDILAWLSDAPNDTFEEEEPLIKKESIKKETKSIYDFNDEDNTKSPIKPFKSIKQEYVDNDFDEIPDLDGSYDSGDNNDNDDNYDVDDNYDDPNRLYCLCKKVGINSQQLYIKSHLLTKRFLHGG